MATQTKERTNTAPKWRILVVENDPQTRADHVYNLERWGYQTFAAQGEGQALLDDARNLAKRERCQVALVDMRLLSDDDRSDISGLNLTQDLKPTESIVVTGFADKPVYSRVADKKGVLAVYGKEEGPEVLKKAIQGALTKFGNPYPEPEALAKYRTSYPWRVLVVDNDTQERSYYVDLLTKWGYQVYEASRAGAEQEARNHRCHLALVDTDSNIQHLNTALTLKPAAMIIMSASLPSEIRSVASEKDATWVFSKKEGAEKLGAKLTTVLEKCGYKDVNIDWPEELNATRVANHLFPNNPDLFKEEANDVLRRLFKSAGSLRVALLDSQNNTPSLTLRPRSLVVQVKQDDHVRSHFVKIGRKMKAEREVKNFKAVYPFFLANPYIEPTSVPFTFWNIGGAVYDFSGDYVQLRPMLFSKFYGRTNTDGIRNTLENLKDLWSQLYRKRKIQEVRLLDSYVKVWGTDWMDDLQSYAGTHSLVMPPDIQNLPGLSDPIDWLIGKIFDQNGKYRGSKTPFTLVAKTHGDLHGDNFFVTKDHVVWPIDFERTGDGPILQDWVELEHDLLTRLLFLQPFVEWHLYTRLICVIARPREVQAWSRIDARLPNQMNHKQIDKALEVIDKIRDLAKICEGSHTVDAQPYIWGLLLNAVFRLRIWWEEHNEPALPLEKPKEYLERKQKLYLGVQRCFVLAGILCHRLDHWEEGEWPPAEWESMLTSPLEVRPVAQAQPTLPVLKLQLTDLRNSQREFKVSVLAIPNKEPQATSALPYNDDELIAVMKLIELGHYKTGDFYDGQIDALRGLKLLTGDALVGDWVDRVGGQMYETLVPPRESVRTQFENILHAQREGGTLQLTFDKEATVLACYPWELLHDRYPNGPRTEIDVVRYIASDQAATRLEVSRHERPCRVLYISTRPTSLQQVDFDREALKNSIASLAEPGHFEFDELKEHTHQALKARLTDFQLPVHVLHFDGHGMFARHCPHCGLYCQPHLSECTCTGSLADAPAKGYLAFEKSNKKVEWIDTTKMLEGIPRSQIRLVILSSCQSAKIRGADFLLAGVGPGLVLGGVPAVVAMQFSITSDAAINFNKEFYKALVQGDPLPIAVNRARKMLPEPARWSPTLYLRSRDHQIRLCA